MKAAVITFPGSNCDRDGLTALRRQAQRLGMKEEAVVSVWHGDAALPKVDLVLVPGGFTYGDYLRTGAMAAHSPIMQEVKAHAARGGLVLGICNGFQILTEAGLLPGALMRNAGLKFVCRSVHLKVEDTKSVFTQGYAPGQIIDIPIAHHDGNYFADAETLKRLEDNNQVAFRYVDASGQPTADANPNGSQHNIAGIVNEARNVLGMMPHPERHAEELVGGADGAALLSALLAASKKFSLPLEGGGSGWGWSYKHRTWPPHPHPSLPPSRGKEHTERDPLYDRHRPHRSHQNLHPAPRLRRHGEGIRVEGGGICQGPRHPWPHAEHDGTGYLLGDVE